MNIHYDVNGLLTVVCKVTLRSSCLGCLELAREEGGGGGRRVLLAHMRHIKESAGSRQIDR